MNKGINEEYWQIIWEKFKSGDKDAFQTIYNEFVDVLFSYGMRITSDRDLLKDSIQDLFLDVYTYGGKLRQPQFLEYYLYKSLKRIIIKKLTERNRYTSIQEVTDSFELKFSIEDKILDDNSEENLKLLQKEISNLDSAKRELLFLKFNSAMTYEEIGKLLNIKPDTAKKQVHRALKNIRKNFADAVIFFVTTCYKT